MRRFYFPEETPLDSVEKTFEDYVRVYRISEKYGGDFGNREAHVLDNSFFYDNLSREIFYSSKKARLKEN